MQTNILSCIFKVFCIIFIITQWFSSILALFSSSLLLSTLTFSHLISPNLSTNSMHNSTINNIGTKINNMFSLLNGNTKRESMSQGFTSIMQTPETDTLLKLSEMILSKLMILICLSPTLYYMGFQRPSNQVLSILINTSLVNHQMLSMILGTRTLLREFPNIPFGNRLISMGHGLPMQLTF